jgi:hypothetical protein
MKMVGPPEPLFGLALAEDGEKGPVRPELICPDSCDSSSDRQLALALAEFRPERLPTLELLPSVIDDVRGDP